jgi:Domain of unknown function (DUF6898)
VSAKGAGEEVIFEIRQLGEVQRVAAVHVASGVEVVIQAPASALRAEVEAVALAKLEHALGRTLAGVAPARPRPGKLV